MTAQTQGMSDFIDTYPTCTIHARLWWTGPADPLDAGAELERHYAA